MRTEYEVPLHRPDKHRFLGTLIEVFPVWRKGAAIGGTLLFAILLSALIKAAGLLPLALSSATDVEYSFTGSPPAGSEARMFESFRSGGLVFSCNSALYGEGINLVKVTCRATDLDASSYSKLIAEIDRRDWADVEPDDMEMASSAAPDASSIAIVCAVYLALAWGLVRATTAGWGWAELRLLRWKTLAYLISPIAFIAFVTATVALIGLVMPGGENADVAVQTSTMTPSISAGALLFLLLPVIAAAPEEALFRGWLHERLFSRLPTWVAYLVIAEFFVLMHVGVVAGMFTGGAQGTLAVFQVAMIFLVSILMTWIRRSSGSVLLCVIVHAIYNAAIVAGAGF